MEKIGYLKAEKKVFCEVCSSSYKRKMKAAIYKNTPEEKEEAKKKLFKKLSEKYICKICKSIIRTV